MQKIIDQDGDLIAAAQTKMRSVIFFNFSRLLVKDEIKKGSFSMDFCVDATYPHTHTEKVRIADTGAATSYKVNSPAGEYGILSASNLAGTPLAANSPVDHDASAVGLIFYQAGIVAVTSSLFLGVQTTGSSTPSIPAGLLASATHPKMRTTSGNDTDDSTINHLITGSTLNKLADSIRHRIANVQFNNTTELNSSIYFCRANHNEFNYSSNPTYLNGSKIQVKGNDITAPPKAYVTTVGLYSADNELLAVAKLSEPLRKDPTNELTLRVRLDY